MFLTIKEAEKKMHISLVTLLEDIDNAFWLNDTYL